MKRFLKVIGVLAGLAVLAVIVTIALIPWMDRWGATGSEITVSFSGDELVPSPHVVYNRAVTISASPEEIYPWIVQLGAERGGMYSYSWFETNILQCELINADRLHEEWQDLHVGDKIKMCPKEGWGPPPYEVGLMEPDKALVLGHQENGKWGDVWQFILMPKENGSTRLILRSRDTKEGLIWDMFRPGEFIMSRGMLLGIKERAETLGDTGSIVLENVHLDIASTTLNRSFPAGCTGQPPACTQAQNGYNFLSVTFRPQDLPEGQMLAYKILPAVSIALGGEIDVPYSLHKYENASHLLTLGFEVPEGATTFGLQWADLMEIPLEITQSATHLQTISLFAFGHNISLSYDSTLVPQVETAIVPAVPTSDQILFAASHPAYAQIRFLGFQADGTYQLPVASEENNVPQVMVFQTKDFPGYGDSNPQGFINQWKALTETLKTGVDSDQCGKPLPEYNLALPFLPWINMKQFFCAQPQIIEFAGGKGIRYLSHYAQDVGPALDSEIFYTFQGVTEDGKFYISALFPVRTGIFLKEPSPCSQCGDPNYDPAPEWKAQLTEQLVQLKAQSDYDFAPSLTTLDGVVKSIHVGQ